MRDPNLVRVVLDGKELSNFRDGVTIDMGADQIADGFSIACPWSSEDATSRRLFRPFGYQPVQIYLGDDIMLNGTVEKVTPGLSASDKTITIEGRSKPGILCDCSIDAETEFSGLMLSDIARQLAKALGVQVRVDCPELMLPIIETRAEYGQTVGDYLNSIASPRNILLNSSFDGKLVISSGKSHLSKTPSADLEEGLLPLLSVVPSFDGSKRFSRYKVASQFAGSDILGEASDSGVSIFRPHFLSAKETDTDPSQTAARARAEALAQAMQIPVSVAGWRRPDGGRWAERQIVNLKAPSAMIYDKTAWLINHATMMLSAGNGLTTELSLVPRELYAGVQPKEPRWV
jgi:prophage tail gpP-like protein